MIKNVFFLISLLLIWHLSANDQAPYVQNNLNNCKVANKSHVEKRTVTLLQDEKEEVPFDWKMMQLKTDSSGCCGLKFEKKHKLAIVAIFKDESKHLKEWIEYHRLIGVDHFYLYSNNSRDSPGFTLREYVKNGLVTLTYWPSTISKSNHEKPFVWALSTQVTAYQNAVLLYGENVEWMVFLDIDEFLSPIKGESLLSILEQYKKHPGILLSSDHFDASTTYDAARKKLVIEAVAMIEEPLFILEQSVEKTIFQPSFCEKYTWPPFRCAFKEDKKPIRLSKFELCVNHYVNRLKGNQISNRKSYRSNRLLSEQETIDLLKNGYEIEDQKRPIQRFLPELRKKMGY